jgi:small multidrug resistance family-3 protein
LTRLGVSILVSPGESCASCWRGRAGALAGLLEIGGGYLVWHWWRAGGRWWIGAVGGLVPFLYGVVPTYQPVHFGRVYAAYGGWFVVISLAWGWTVERVSPDRYDIVGGLICLVGVAVIMYWPR